MFNVSWSHFLYHFNTNTHFIQQNLDFKFFYFYVFKRWISSPIFLILLTSLDLFGLLFSILTDGFIYIYIFFFQLGSSSFLMMLSHFGKKTLFWSDFILHMEILLFLDTYASLEAIAFLGTVFLFKGCCITC